MKKIVFLLSYCFICSVMFAQVENKVIYNNDKNIPSYYIFTDQAGSTFYRNGKTDDVTSHLKTIGTMGWSPGIYIAVAQVDGQYVSSKFVVSK